LQAEVLCGLRSRTSCARRSQLLPRRSDKPSSPKKKRNPSFFAEAKARHQPNSPRPEPSHAVSGNLLAAGVVSRKIYHTQSLEVFARGVFQASRCQPSASRGSRRVHVAVTLEQQWASVALGVSPGSKSCYFLASEGWFWRTFIKVGATGLWLARAPCLVLGLASRHTYKRRE